MKEVGRLDETNSTSSTILGVPLIQLLNNICQLTTIAKHCPMCFMP